MSYKPPQLLLRGMPYNYAVMMGMPDVISHYCHVCGKQRTNDHHMVPKGRGNKFLTLHDVKLESPLLSLCGNGTTGCHGLFHSPRLYVIVWHWFDETVERQWWEGDLFRDGLKPKDPILHAFGEYVLYHKEWDADAKCDRWTELKVIR